MANGWVGKWWLAEFKELILPPALYVASSGYDLDFPEFWQIENDILSKDEWNLEQEKLYYKKYNFCFAVSIWYISLHFQWPSGLFVLDGHGAKANDTSLLVWNSDPGPWP